MQKLGIAALIVTTSLVLGATVLREPVAWAAQVVDAHITNVDANGDIRVHEQGTANVSVMNDLVPVHEQGTAHVGGTVGLDPSANTVKIDSSEPLATSDVNAPTGPGSEPVVIAAVGGTIPEGVACLPFDRASRYTVPPGHELVIEYADAQVSSLSGDEAAAVDLTVSDPRGSRGWQLTGHRDYVSNVAWQFSQLLKLYVPAGDTVSLGACRGNPSFSFTSHPDVVISFSGYLVSRP
jgi:hypothetical protein